MEGNLKEKVSFLGGNFAEKKGTWKETPCSKSGSTFKVQQNFHHEGDSHRR